MNDTIGRLSPGEAASQAGSLAMAFAVSHEIEDSLLRVEADPLLLHDREGETAVHWIATFTSTALRVDLRARRVAHTQISLNGGHLWSADYGDQMDLMAAVPWSAVAMSSSGVQRHLFLMAQNGAGYRKFLALFPAVRCEPLELFYVFRRVTGALNFAIAKDLLSAHGWHGANHGAWLILLAPRPEYMPLLVDAEPRWKHARPAIELAMAACGGYSLLAPDLLESHRHGASVREMLDELPPVHVPVRPPFTEAMLRQLKKERAAIRTLYRTHGLGAAKEAMGKGMLGYLSLRHLEWVKLGCPPPPEIGVEPAPYTMEEEGSWQAPPAPATEAPPRAKAWWKLW